MNHVVVLGVRNLTDTRITELDFKHAGTPSQDWTPSSFLLITYRIVSTVQTRRKETGDLSAGVAYLKPAKHTVLYQPIRDSSVRNCITYLGNVACDACDRCYPLRLQHLPTLPCLQGILSSAEGLILNISQVGFSLFRKAGRR